MVFLRKYVAVFLAILLLSYYLILSWVLHRTGYEHSESLFLAEKARLLFEVKSNTLLTLGTTFPTIPYLSTVVFSLFGYPFAPILASATFTTLIFFVIAQDFAKTNMQRRFFIPMLCLIFFLHPGLIYAGTTGRSVAVQLLFFFLLFRSLFIYYKTQTTFSLSMASIYLTCLIFCNFNFIWLILALVPFVLLISLEGLKQSKYGSPIVQYYESVNNRSQRRKLTLRTVAIYIILFLLPIGTVYLFRLLNSLHAGNPTYFLTSQYANWSITGNNSLGSIFLGENLVGRNVLSQTQIIFQGYILLLTPLMIYVFYIFRGRLYELLTLIAPLIFIGILLLDNQIYLTIEYYLIFLVLALIGVYTYSGKKFGVKAMYPFLMLIALINIITGIMYFERSSDREEKAFFGTLKSAAKWNGERAYSEEYKMATYISNLMSREITLKEKNKILMDDAAAYAIVAQLRKLGTNVILPVDFNFITVAENPMTEAKYVCVAKESNRLKSFTVLNSYNLNKIAKHDALVTTMMFETENWAVYRLDKMDPDFITSTVQ